MNPPTVSPNVQSFASGGAGSYISNAALNAQPGQSAYDTQSANGTTYVAPTSISADSLGGNSSALKVPNPAPYTNVGQPAYVTPPGGTTTNENGTVSVPQNDNTYAKTALENIIGKLGTEGDVTTQLQNEYGLAAKTTQATQDYNAYITAKQDLANQVSNIYRNSAGMNKEAVAEAVNNATRIGNENVSNLALQATLSQGLLTSAEKIITDKVNAQFQPLKDQEAALKDFITINNNDLTDSQKITLQAKLDQTKTDNASVQAATTDASKVLAQAHAPASEFSKIDKIVNSYKSGKISAQDASSQIEQVTSGYAPNPNIKTTTVTNADGSTSLVKIDGQGNVVGMTTINQAGNATGGNLPTVPMTATGAPDPTTQQQFLSSLPKEIATLVKGLADYQINPNSFTTRNYKGAANLTKSQILNLVMQYDPTYSEAQYAARASLQTNFASGKYSQNVNALNTAIGHLNDLATNFASLGNSGFTPFNWVKNTAAQTFGSGSITSAATNIQASVGELATVFKGSGATDQEISNLGTIGPNSSPAQAKSFIQTSINLLASRLQALTDTYTSGMGKPPATSFLSQTNVDRLEALKNQGYKVDIPGVYYTDASAYFKADSSNQDAFNKVHQENPNLTPAQTLQYTQYLQENGFI